MKKMRSICALLLCALFIMPGSVAQAAKKKTLDRTEVPSVTLIQPQYTRVTDGDDGDDIAPNGLISGSILYLDFTATLPGFITLRLTPSRP